MKEKEPCSYCGKPTGNKPMHEKYCPNNPNRLQSSEVKTDATAGDNTTRTVEKTVTSAPAVSNKKLLVPLYYHQILKIIGP